MRETPVTDKTLQAFDLLTPEGKPLRETITQGQKEIAEIILNRRAPDGKRKIHIMAHTRYGKSMIIGNFVAIRAAVKKEPWTIIAPSKDQAQIIMDYSITASVNEPIIASLLKTDANVLKEERLTQRRARDHITYLNGGELRTFHAGGVIGFGGKNIIFDEASLTDDQTEAKVFRMLGDDAEDFFIIKIGNPFYNNHFRKAFDDPSYYHINIPAAQGIAEGRVTVSFLDEARTKPFYDILYENTFPDEESKDEHGYTPLLSHKKVKDALVAPGREMLGIRKLGADPSDAGANMSAIAERGVNLARIIFTSYTTDEIAFADEIAIRAKDAAEIHTDKQGVGSATARRLADLKETKHKTVGVNSSLPVTKDMIPENEDPKLFRNIRAYVFWSMKRWIEQGGKIEDTEGLEKQLLALRYKITDGKIQIVSKEELGKWYNTHDLGLADAISYTFDPQKPEGYATPSGVVGGVEPIYPELGMA